MAHSVLTYQTPLRLLSSAVFAKICIVSRAQRSQLNSAARANPLYRRRSRNERSSSARWIVDDISSTELGSKYSRALPEISGRQELFETTVGTPHAIASTIGRQKPS